MPLIACPSKIICPCEDDPVSNYSSEAPDNPQFIGIFNFAGSPPLGYLFGQAGCKAYCTSEVSQEDADLCAQRQAQLCVWETWIPPGQTSPPASVYYSAPVNCTIRCSDNHICQPGECAGEQTFDWFLPAGSVIALSQYEADVLGQSLACRLATLHKICFTSAKRLADACLDGSYSFQVKASGGTPFAFPYILGPNTPSDFLGCTAAPGNDPIPYIWEVIAGALPSGLTINKCTGEITGTPTASGLIPFTLRITDSIGSIQTKAFEICVIEIAPGTLPNGTTGGAYSQTLSVSSCASGPASWQVDSGSLPPGLTLDDLTGVLSGTPTLAGSYNFTIAAQF